MKYYATFDLPGISDIFAFNSKAARDEWVNFLDEFSRATKTTADNCTFGRLAIDAPEDIRLIKALITGCAYKDRIYDAVVYCLSEVLL